MASKSFVIKSRYILKECLDYISRIEILPDKPFTIYIEEYKKATDEKRKACQNRLYWMWLHDMEKTNIEEYSGWSDKYWHREMKVKYLVPIFERDDQGYAEMMASIYKIKEAGYRDDYRVIYKNVIEITSTRDATIKQFSEYLKNIEHFCHSKGIVLRTDNYLYEMSINR